MILSEIKINKFSRLTAKATLLGLSLATSMFWVSSQLPSSKAMACLPGLDSTGFVCKTVDQVTEQAERENIDVSRQFFIAPFNQVNNADVLRALLIAVNFVIVVRLLWKGYRAWKRSKANEEL